MKAGRVLYRDAGAAMRDVLRRANQAHPPLGARERAVLDAVLVTTVSYSKLTDTTTARELAAVAFGVEPERVHGRQRERVRELLDTLAGRGLIIMTPCGRGRYARLVVGVEDLSPLVAGGFDESGDESTPPTAGLNTPHGGSPIPPASGAHLEDLEESEKRESALLEKLCKRNQRVDRFEWEALLARHHARGLSTETLEQVVTLCLERGEVWPSKYDAELNRCSVRSSIFDDINTWAVNRGPRPKDDCPKCQGKGWYWREGERTEYVDCGCAQTEAVAS